MRQNYGRDLDLNLLRVFAVVADAGSVTAAAASLYLTQPAVSAALRRLQQAVGARLFVRRGRGLALTGRGLRLRADLQPHLAALIEAALAPAAFDPSTSERTIKLGLSDSMEVLLLPRLVRALAARAPRLRLIAVPIQFRTVGAALASGAIDVAITIADELPASVRREPLFSGGFVCLYDPRHGTAPRGARAYFAREHVIVSYNGDLRGVVEDALRTPRRVRVSVARFAHVGALVDGGPLIATVPATVAAAIRETYPHLRTSALPFALPRGTTELLWPATTDDDDACAFVRSLVIELAPRSRR